MEQAGVEILKRLRASGFEAWWVGGCVRDRLLGLPMKDIDIATNARPEDLTRLFENVKLVGARFGVCIVSMGEHDVEVATFRRDGRYVDQRRPESVEYGTAEDDARRRDFTANAIYFDPVDGAYFDPTHGREDVGRRVLRAVGDPRARFKEDALRLLRGVRFASRLEFEIESATWAALCGLAPDIRAISPERIRDELTRMFVGPHPARALNLLDESGLLEIVLPEISAMKGVEQGRRYHPEGDVFVHTLLAMEKLEPRTPITAWAMLLHDIGKPRTFARAEDGRITFYEHERVGAEMARVICERLRFSNEDAEQIVAVVARHMRFMFARQWNRTTMRRFLAADTIESDLAVHRADCLASNGILENWEKVRGELEALRTRKEPVLPPALLTGDDLIRLGFQPGPLFREILNAVQEEQIEGRITTPAGAESFVRGGWSTN